MCERFFDHAKNRHLSFQLFSILRRSPEIFSSALLAARSSNVSKLSQNLFFVVSFGVIIALLITAVVAQSNERLAKRTQKKVLCFGAVRDAECLVHTNEQTIALVTFLKLFSTIQKFSKDVLNAANYFS